MVTKPTGRREGRPDWDLPTARDRYLIGAFWATVIAENKLKGDPKATRHMIAMSFAAMERGELMLSADNLATLSGGKGKLEFRTKIGIWQRMSRPDADDIKKRADDIRRKAARAMKSDSTWVSMMAAAFMAAFYEQNRDRALGLANAGCAALSETAFFERSLKPFIVGRFDPSKKVVFSLPEFMPNFF